MGIDDNIFLARLAGSTCWLNLSAPLLNGVGIELAHRIHCGPTDPHTGSVASVQL